MITLSATCSETQHFFNQVGQILVENYLKKNGHSIHSFLTFFKKKKKVMII